MDYDCVYLLCNNKVKNCNSQFCSFVLSAITSICSAVAAAFSLEIQVFIWSDKILTKVTKIFVWSIVGVPF